MAEPNTNSRLEAFCDGVFSIALTLLIINIKTPSRESINSTSDLWLSLKHLLPSFFAFLLSFVIILITWVNHHATIKLVDKSSSPFVYANGFLLLTVVVLPFPTGLLGDYLFTDYAAPAVVLYTAAHVLQTIGWILVSHTSLKPNLLTKNEKSTLAMRENIRKSYFGLITYSVFAIIAFWFPLTIASLISVMWIGWVIHGLNIKAE